MTTLSGTAQPAPAAGLARHLRGRVTEPDSPDWDTARRRDLFWALRGAGGGFALVTHLDLALARTPALFGGQLIWPVDAAPEVFGAWASWAPGLTRDTTSSAGVLQFPPLPELPEVFVAQTRASIRLTAAAGRNPAPRRRLCPASAAVRWPRRDRPHRRSVPDRTRRRRPRPAGRRGRSRLPGHRDGRPQPMDDRHHSAQLRGPGYRPQPAVQPRNPAAPRRRQAPLRPSQCHLHQLPSHRIGVAGPSRDCGHRLSFRSGVAA